VSYIYHQNSVELTTNALKEDIRAVGVHEKRPSVKNQDGVLRILCPDRFEPASDAAEVVMLNEREIAFGRHSTLH
jgi:hypothetical protein